MYLLLLIIGAIASVWLVWRYKHRRMIRMARGIPGPPTVPLLGNALRFMGKPEDLIDEIQRLLVEYGDVVRFWLGPDLNIVVNDPDDLKLLLTSPKTTVKGPQYKYMADVLGEGILSGMHLLLLLIGAIASVWVVWRYKHRRMIRMARGIPGPPTVPLLGNALRFMGQPENLIKEIQMLPVKYGDVVRFWLGPDLNIIVTNPDDLKLLLTSPKATVKGPQYKYMADVIGEGLLSGSGPLWRKHRKMVMQINGKRANESYNDVFNSEADILIRDLRKTRGQIDANKYFVQTTSYAVCQTLMGLTRQQTLGLPHFRKIVEITPRFYSIVFDRMTKWYLQIDPVFWMTEAYQTHRYFIKIMTEFCKAIIQHGVDKLNNSENDVEDTEQDSVVNTKLSVIDRFILSRELNSNELVHETFTVFTASQEASGKIATYLILMMAFHPTCQEKLYADIINVFSNEDRPVTDEDLRQMPYLEMVFKEVLRLFPIGAMLQRTVTEDITISSCTIPAGASLMAPIYQLQRDPRYWQNPEEFDPERFSPENTQLRNPNCYIPFSAGPMDCLGRYFAAKLVKTICVKVLKEFEITSLQSYKDFKVIIAISVHSLTGYPIVLKPRKK